MSDTSNTPGSSPFEALEREWLARSAAPRTHRLVALVVRLPRADRRGSSRRFLPQSAALSIDGGLEGDRWAVERREDLGDAREVTPTFADRQLTVMELRSIECISAGRDLFGHLALELPGDNLVVDFDLSTTNLPIGARFTVGGATLEVTAPPHLGCKKFEARYGPTALAWVNSPSGRERRLRGLNARVITPAVVSVGALVGHPR
jgi:hypothetical protein